MEFRRMLYDVRPVSAIVQRKLENKLVALPMMVVNVDDILNLIFFVLNPNGYPAL